MTDDIKIGISTTGQAEIGKQLNDSASKVSQTTTGMSNIIQKANQYFQQATQSKNLLDQKDQQHHRKELERIQKEIEARKILLEETTGRPATTTQAQARRTLQIQQEQRAIEQLERQATVPFTPTARPPMRIPGARGAMRIGASVAGLLGAYSLFSKIGGGLSEASEQGDLLANAMLTTPSGGRGGGFGAVRENIFGGGIAETLKELGQVSLITGKDMKPMIEAMREVGDLSEKQSKVQIQIANEARRMATDPTISGKAQVDLMRAGIIGKPSDFLGIQQDIFRTPGMSHRAEEMLRTFSETVLATTQGPTGAGGGQVIKNLLNAFNVSGMPMYRGSRGGQLLTTLDQAFRGGGDETFELFQYQALSPLAQARNRAAGKGFKGSPSGKLGSGMYDAVLADLAQSMGAFATTETMQAKLTSLGLGDISQYFGEQFKGSGTNIERTMQTFARGMGIKLGADTPSAQKVQFASQFAKSIGMEGSEMDILAFMKIMGSGGKESFLQEGKGLSKGNLFALAKAKQEGDKEAIDRIKNQKTLEQIWQKIGTSLDKVIVENKDAIIMLAGHVETGANALFSLTRFLNKWFTIEVSDEETIKKEKEFSRIAGNLITGFDPTTEKLLRSYALKKKELGEMGQIGERELFMAISGVRTGGDTIVDSPMTQAARSATLYRKVYERQTGVPMQDETFAKLLAREVGQEIAKKIIETQKGIRVETIFVGDKNKKVPLPGSKISQDAVP